MDGVKKAVRLGALCASAILSGCVGGTDAPHSSGGRLSADQCNYFESGGRVTICHATGSSRNPYVVLRIAEAACVNAHAGHSGDRIAPDGNCGPDACLPVGAPDDGTVRCCAGLSSSGGVCVCAAGTANCDGNAVNGCEVNTTTVSNCGACGVVCPTRANALSTCGSGSCGFTCDPGFADCNGDAADGCEAAVGAACSPSACASGHVACAAGATACVQDALLPSTTECRPSAGVCDVAETCTGTSPDCPSDGFAPATTECRASAGVCDVAESCTGASAGCPTDGSVADGTACDNATVCDGREVCLAGACSAGTALSCPSSPPCLVGTCHATSGCAMAPAADGTACDDGNPGTNQDVCAMGVCTGGCAAGYTSSGGTCVDIDECAAVPAPVTAVCSWNVGAQHSVNEYAGTWSNPFSAWSYFYSAGGSYGTLAEYVSSAPVLYNSAQHTSAWYGSPTLRGYENNIAYNVPMVVTNMSPNPAGATTPYGAHVNFAELLYHPGPPSSAGRYNTIRWTAPVTGTFRVTAAWRVAHGAQVDFAVLRNRALPALATGRSPGAYTGTVTLAAGETLEFALGFGNDFGSTTTGIGVQVQRLDGGCPSNCVDANANGVCDEFDIARPSVCASGSTCVNLPGSYRCETSPGATPGSAGTSCMALRSAGVTTTGPYWVNPGTGPVRVWCEMERDGGGYMLVARLASTGDMPPWNFDLQPNHSYGTYVPDLSNNNNFYMNWSAFPYTRFLFSTVDRAVWLVSEPSNFTAIYANDLRPVLSSNLSPGPTFYRWYNRGAGVPEDPWVSVGDHVGQILYGEAGWPGCGSACPVPHTVTKNTHGGIGVYVR